MCYKDDLLVLEKNKKVQDNNLRRLLGRAQQNKIKFNMSKFNLKVK